MDQETVVRLAKEMVEKGLIVIDGVGNAWLTEKGKRAAAARLDLIPTEDEFLIMLAFAEHHRIPVSLG
ncbi:hypothetical protein [Paenibacillus caseinilyticus]|uniref:hypothetical protein n=1 Tax=Paenibacillus caseinilyticus TaxID=3098138 RepID=UPI0022B8A7E1|nr:hypothetical protein [Paenibacillus caseinilyticus]MCZ8518862.1 hypothetical protein [Paenibacillus caseinilyticus]